MSMDAYHFQLDDARHRTGVKWTKYGPDVIPLWVADMDFAVAPAIQEALSEFVGLGEFGYTNPEEARATRADAAAWFGRRHDVEVDPDAGAVTRDVMQAVAGSLAAFTEPGDGVIVHTPIYPPFPQAVTSAGRRMLACPLTGDHQIDLELTDQLAADASAILLSNPHNPTGRVFNRDELRGVASIADRHDLTIISDEIHADLVYSPFRHKPIVAIPEASGRTVTIMAASKTFNIAGIGCGIVFFGSPELEKRFAALPASLIGHPRAFNLRVSAAAWRGGAPWLKQTMETLAVNRATVTEWANRHGVASTLPEATYLTWLDFRIMRWAEEPFEVFLRDARVALSAGLDFGAAEGFARLNFATSPEILATALAAMGAVANTR